MVSLFSICWSLLIVFVLIRISMLLYAHFRCLCPSEYMHRTAQALSSAWHMSKSIIFHACIRWAAQKPNDHTTNDIHVVFFFAVHFGAQVNAAVVLAFEMTIFIMTSFSLKTIEWNMRSDEQQREIQWPKLSISCGVTIHRLKFVSR